MTEHQNPLATPLPMTALAAIGLCPERTQALMAVLRREVASGRLPGAVAMVARHGQVGLLEAVGQQDPSKGTPMQTPQFTAPTMTPSQGMPGGLGSQSAGLFDQYMRDMLMQQGTRATTPRPPERGPGTY